MAAKTHCFAVDKKKSGLMSARIVNKLLSTGSCVTEIQHKGVQAKECKY